MSNFPTSAGVHGGKDESGVPLKGVSGAEVEEFKMMSLVEIVVLIKFIFDRKKFENVLHSFWFSSSDFALLLSFILVCFAIEYCIF